MILYVFIARLWFSYQSLLFSCELKIINAHKTENIIVSLPKAVYECETPGSPTIKTAMYSIVKKLNECTVLYVGVVFHDSEFCGVY